VHHFLCYFFNIHSCLEVGVALSQTVFQSYISLRKQLNCVLEAVVEKVPVSETCACRTSQKLPNLLQDSGATWCSGTNRLCLKLLFCDIGCMPSTLTPMITSQCTVAREEHVLYFQQDYIFLDTDTYQCSYFIQWSTVMSTCACHLNTHLAHNGHPLSVQFGEQVLLHQP